MSGDLNLNSRFAPASRPAGVPSALRDAGSVRERQARIAERAQSQFKENRPQWIAARYSKLLAKESAAPALKPAWAVDDRKAHLMRAAAQLADRDHQLRMRRIDRAADRMIRGRNAAELSR